MSDEEVRNFLNHQKAESLLQPRMVMKKPARPRQQQQEGTYKDFNATHLFCPTCKQAMPVRQRVMLYLPDGQLFQYSCQRCMTSLGTRKA